MAALSPNFSSPLDPGKTATGFAGAVEFLRPLTPIGSNTGADGINYWSTRYYFDHPGVLPKDIK